MAPARKEPKMDTYSQRLSVRMRKLREEAGFTVEEVVERMAKFGYEVPVQTYYKWENQRTVPRLDAMPAFAKSVKMKVREIFPSK